MAGDLAGFEEATRALFAGDQARLEQHSAAWPADVRAYALKLLEGPPNDDLPRTDPGDRARRGARQAKGWSMRW